MKTIIHSQELGTKEIDGDTEVKEDVYRIDSFVDSKDSRIGETCFSFSEGSLSIDGTLPKLEGDESPLRFRVCIGAGTAKQFYQVMKNFYEQ